MANELILIIEDNDNSRKLLRDVLQVKGYETIESETGEEGLRLAMQRRPALILMDIQLPGISGIEALQALRADPQTRDTPVIAVTASVMHNQQGAITNAGFDALERKPISVSSLLVKIRELLERGKKGA
jgi:two-component system, cell cycle response regulator DivK